MNSWWRLQLWLVAGLAALSLGLLVPSVCGPGADTPKQAWPAWYAWYAANVFDGRLAAGLDLEGGIELVYRLDLPGAGDGRGDVDGGSPQRGRRVVGGRGAGDADDGALAITHDVLDHDPVRPLDPRAGSGEGGIEADEGRPALVEAAAAAMRARLKSIEGAHADVRPRGDAHVVVRLALTDERAIGRALEPLEPGPRVAFHGLHPDDDRFWGTVGDRVWDEDAVTSTASAITSTDPDALRRFVGALRGLPEGHPAGIPADAAVAFVEPGVEDQPAVSPPDDGAPHRAALLEVPAALRGEDIDDVRIAHDERTGRPFLSLTFAGEARARLCEVTEGLQGRKLAIVVGDVVKSLPRIMEPICAGRVRLDLGSHAAASTREGLSPGAEGLFAALQKASVRAPVERVSEAIVTPTVGTSARWVLAVGLLLLVLGALASVVARHGGLGIWACGGLLLNALMALAGLAWWGAAVNLPTLAGLVLGWLCAAAFVGSVLAWVRRARREGRSPADGLEGGLGPRFWWAIAGVAIVTFCGGLLAAIGEGGTRAFGLALACAGAASWVAPLWVTRLGLERGATEASASASPGGQR